MATGNEISGRYVGEIDVSVEVENRGGWLCCGWKYLRLILTGRVPQDWLWEWEMVPGIGVHFGCFGSD